MLRKRQEGQTLTEFAMVLPLLALLLFGVIQFGIVFHQYVTLTDSVRAGGRQGAVSRDLAGPEARVIDRVRRSAADLDPAKLDVTVSSTWTQGDDVTVTATYPYDISLLGIVVKSGDLRASTTERVE
ncbi:MAG: TadE/TadG family type IV pilus assembly protein [Candidatus Rokuibacteriota bacterium]